MRQRFLNPLMVVPLIVALPSFLFAQDSTGKKPSAEDLAFFERKIRPLLVDQCFKCHADKKQRGDLRVDSRQALLEGGESGPALVPGKPEQSSLIKAIGYKDDHLKMPPNQPLTKEQVADLTRWVQIGAPWPGDTGVATAPKPRGEMQVTDKDRAFWSFQPVRKPPLPAVKEPTWASNEIDAFILSRLEAKGLKPNPPADPRELIRRLYYDLTGLPPSPQEVETFAADPSPRAYGATVDRLLASPRYGEKWGRHWLDLVRFAETNSYERDDPKPHAWRYRDYVIRSLNEDKPYTRFLKEHLAGDELPDGGTDGLIATGFYRLGIWDDEPTDTEQSRYDGLDDIITVTGQVFLGLTVDCARCHDHKIDPIPQRDYYRLLSFFQNINHYRNGGPTDEAVLLADRQAREQHERRQRELEAKRNAAQLALNAAEEEIRKLYQKDEGIQASQKDIDDLRYRFYRNTFEELPDFSSLKHEEEGRLPKGLFDLTPRTRHEAFGFVFEGTLIVPREGRYIFFLDSDDGARLLVNGEKIVEYDGIHGLGKERRGSVQLSAGRVPIRLEYFQNQFGLGLQVAWSGPGLERRWLSAQTQQEARAQDINQLLRRDGSRVIGQQRLTQFRQLRRQLEALKSQKIEAERALCVTEAGRRAPDTHVLVRGNPHVRGVKVEPGFLEVLGGGQPTLPELPAEARTTGRRTALANWITSKDHPLTARVLANRVWQYHFGRGIVRSPNNFGLQGDKPTHPELLDWLASELVAGGWRLKPLHRQIVMSSTYRQSSRAHPEGLEADPTNDLFWRFDPRRLTAEEIRDSLLSVTGVLNLKMFGPGVYVDIPAEVMAGQSKPGYGWGKSSAEEQARRSIYIHVKRSLLTPILESFDLAETDRPSPVRFSTTQPTQALGMLNGEFLGQQASTFADRLAREASKPADQVRLALTLVTQRPARDDEIRRGLELIESLKKHGADDRLALKYFCLMALNLNEFLYLD